MQNLVILMLSNSNCTRRDLMKDIICILTQVTYDGLECTIPNHIQVAVQNLNQLLPYFQNISPEEPVAVFDHTSIIESTISIPAETPTRDTIYLASRLSCITLEQPVPTTPDEVIIPAETPARVAMVPGSSLSCNILGNPSVPDACRTPDGGMNFASAEGSMSVAKAPVLQSGITPEQTVQRSLTNASAETPS